MKPLTTIKHNDAFILLPNNFVCIFTNIVFIFLSGYASMLRIDYKFGVDIIIRVICEGMMTDFEMWSMFQRRS